MPTESSLRERLEASERRYRVLADNLVDTIWVIDAETGRYEYISPSVLDMRGFTAEEVVSAHTLNDSLAPGFQAEAQKILAENLEKYHQGRDRMINMEAELNCKDGSTVWTEMRMRFLKEGDEPLRIIGVSRDITERRSFEASQKKLIRKLEKTLVEKEKLLKENKVLRGLLPICAQCKKIRDEDGNWFDLEVFIEEHSQAEFTHTICPDCKKTLYPELPSSKA